jgi:hypothetical protein
MFYRTTSSVPISSETSSVSTSLTVVPPISSVLPSGTSSPTTSTPLSSATVSGSGTTTPTTTTSVSATSSTAAAVGLGRELGLEGIVKKVAVVGAGVVLGGLVL